VIRPAQAAILLAAAGLVALAVTSWFAINLRNEAPLEISGFVTSEPRPLPDFTLLDGNGEAFGSRDFAGTWSFVYFGYTYCPDICPMSMVEMARIADALAQRSVDVPVSYYLVSLDPDRDTPERMGEYAAYFDPSFVGLTGDPDEIGRFARSAGVVYELPEDTSSRDYLVGHSSFFTLLNPAGEIHAFFTGDLDGERIAGEFLQIAERAGF
jgi:protein SCO1/2